MYQEERYLTNENGNVKVRLKQGQSAIIDGNAAVVFDWHEEVLLFYDYEGEKHEVVLPKNESWYKAEADYGVLRIKGNQGGSLAYLMTGKFLGYYKAIADVPVAHGIEVRAVDEEEKWTVIRAVRW